MTRRLFPFVSGKWFQTEHRLWQQTAMLTPSFESLCLKDDDCSSPTQPRGMEDEFDTDLESDGKYIKFICGLILGQKQYAISQIKIKIKIQLNGLFWQSVAVKTYIHYFVYKQEPCVTHNGLTHFQKKRRATRRHLYLNCTSRPANWWVWCQSHTL